MDIYDDDFVGTPVDENFPINSQRDLQLARFLKPDPNSPPVRLLGPNFAPSGLIAKLHRLAAECSGKAGLFCISKPDAACEVIWSDDTYDAVPRLVRIKTNGWILGFVCYSADGSITWKPEEEDPETPLFDLILGTVVRCLLSEQNQLPEFSGREEEATKTLQKLPGARILPGQPR
jgi:hypothetical protein